MSSMNSEPLTSQMEKLSMLEKAGQYDPIYNLSSRSKANIDGGSNPKKGLKSGKKTSNKNSRKKWDLVYKNLSSIPEVVSGNATETYEKNEMMMAQKNKIKPSLKRFKGDPKKKWGLISDNLSSLPQKIKENENKPQSIRDIWNKMGCHPKGKSQKKAVAKVSRSVKYARLLRNHSNAKPEICGPLVVTLDIPELHLNHIQMLELLRDSLFDIQDARITHLQFVDRNVKMGMNSLADRWIITVNKTAAKDKLLNDGIEHKDREFTLYSYDEMALAEHNEYTEYLIKESTRMKVKGSARRLFSKAVLISLANDKKKKKKPKSSSGKKKKQKKQ